MSVDWKQAKVADVVKFTEPGQMLSGTYVGSEPSKMYPDSYVVKVNDGASVVAAFVSKVAIDLITTANILPGQKVKIVYKGKVKNAKGTAEYHTYDVFYQ